MVAVNYLAAAGFILILVVLAFVFTVLQLKNKQKQKGTVALAQSASPVLAPSAPPVTPTPAIAPVDPRVQQLRDVISARLAAGYSQEQLLEALRAKGWDQATLDKAFKGL